LVLFSIKISRYVLCFLRLEPKHGAEMKFFCSRPPVINPLPAGFAASPMPPAPPKNLPEFREKEQELFA
jgi:hypothetical protein